MKELERPFDGREILQHKRSLKKRLLKERDQLLEKKVAILSGATIGEMKHVLELFLLNHGIKPVFWEGNYNRFFEDVMFDHDSFIEFQPDLIYVHTSVKNILEYPEPNFSQEQVENLLDQTFQRYVQMWEKVEKEIGCMIIQNNFEMLPFRSMGNGEVYHHTGCLNFINLLNAKVYHYATSHSNFYVNDLAYQASWYGLKNWFDHAIWYTYKYPFALDAIPWVCHNISNIIKSVYGQNKRALVLDLDNTLWGGVIGDCGVEHIQIGDETPQGMAYTDFQKYLKRLSQLGISLNVCSKNNEEMAWEGFDHRGSVLKKGDFVSASINWDHKNDNIEKLANQINMAYEQMVFIDDHPVERDLVSQTIKDMVVLDIDDPEYYVERLDQQGFFEMTLFSEEDRNRNVYYQNNKERLNEVEKHLSYEAYLNSLQMDCKVMEIGPSNIERITQLINKTNQFNLTTKRYTQHEVEKVVADPNHLSFGAHLTDKFGDNGIISMVLARIEGMVAEIDLWVMSCRVFKRNVEFVMFNELIHRCRDKDVQIIRGYYYPTKKNAIVSEFYRQIGFKLVDENQGSRVWELVIKDAVLK